MKHGLKPGEKIEIVIAVLSKGDGEFRMSYGFDPKNDFEKRASMIFNGLCDGYVRKDPQVLELCDLLLSVTESFKLQFPNVAATTRKTIIEHLKNRK